MTPEQEQILKDNYPDKTMPELVALLNNEFSAKQIGSKRKRMGLHKSAAFREKYGIDANGRVLPGTISRNKGKPRQTLGRMAETQFRKGQKPKNHKPVGTIRTSHDGYLEIKIAEGTFQWRLLHREIWKQHHGSYPPEGHALIFIDGNKQNCAIENLKLLTRQQLMAQNTIQNLPKPLKQVILLTGALRRKINDTTKRRQRTA